jgi:hypothetical protein
VAHAVQAEFSLAVTLRRRGYFAALPRVADANPACRCSERSLSTFGVFMLLIPQSSAGRSPRPGATL